MKKIGKKIKVLPSKIKIIKEIKSEEPLEELVDESSPEFQQSRTTNASAPTLRQREVRESQPESNFESATQTNTRQSVSYNPRPQVQERRSNYERQAITPTIETREIERRAATTPTIRAETTQNAIENQIRTPRIDFNTPGEEARKYQEPDRDIQSTQMSKKKRSLY